MFFQSNKTKRSLDLPLVLLSLSLISLAGCQKSKSDCNKEGKNQKKTSLYSTRSTNKTPSQTWQKKDIQCAPAGKELKSRIEVGIDYTHVNLKPHGTPSFRGNLGGMQGLYEYRPINRFYGAAKLAWKEGDTHGSAGKRSLLYVDVQERLGYTFGSTQRDWRLTLFSGFGYRHLGQKLNPKEGSSVHFRYNEFYFPVGVISDYAFNSWFALGLGFTWMPQVYPTLTIVPLKGARWKLSNTLNNFFVEIPFDFTLTKSKRFHLIFNPFYEHWADGHTTAKTSTGSLGLPGNTYHFWGADLNLAYCF